MIDGTRIKRIMQINHGFSFRYLSVVNLHNPFDPRSINPLKNG